MENNLNQQILDKLTKVCLCKAIPKSRIKEAISNGAHTLEEVQKATGAGTGSCCGRRCNHKIQELVDTHLNNQ